MYPHGKLDSSDAGETSIAVYTQGDTLVMDFGEDMSWIGLDKPAVENLIKLLQDKVTEL